MTNMKKKKRSHFVILINCTDNARSWRALITITDQIIICGNIFIYIWHITTANCFMSFALSLIWFTNCHFGSDSFYDLWLSKFVVRVFFVLYHSVCRNSSHYHFSFCRCCLNRKFIRIDLAFRCKWTKKPTTLLLVMAGSHQWNCK